MEILQRVLSEISRKKLTQKDFCIATGISEKTFSTWKARKTNPPADKLSSIADFLNIPLNQLVTGVSAPSTEKLSLDEQELLSNYRNLDNRGKHKLHTVIYEELDRQSATIKQPSKEDAPISTSQVGSSETA